MSFWVKFDILGSVLGSNQKLIFKEHTISPWLSYEIIFDTNDVLYLQWVNTTSSYETTGFSGSISQDTWYYFVAVRDGSDLLCYFNSSIDSTWNDTVVGSMFDANSNLLLARDTWGMYFNGSLDEVRISNISRSSGWIETEYNNQADPDSFFDIGSEQQVIPPILPATIVEGTRNILAFMNEIMRDHFIELIFLTVFVLLLWIAWSWLSND